jgi:hypothetical protein
MRCWSARDAYDRWPAATAATAAGAGAERSFRPVLIHEVHGTDAVVLVPGTSRPVDTAVVPVSALVPLEEPHHTTTQACLAITERVGARTLEHFIQEWESAQFADVVDGHLVDPLETTREGCVL